MCPNAPNRKFPPSHRRGFPARCARWSRGRYRDRKPDLTRPPPTEPAYTLPVFSSVRSCQPPGRRILQQVGSGQFQAARIEGLEHRVSVQLIVDRDENEEQLPGHGLGQHTRSGSAVVAQFYERFQTLSKLDKTLPQEPIRPRQTPGIAWLPVLYQVVLIDRVVGLIEVEPAALGQGSRILLADEAIAKFARSLTVCICLDTLVSHGPQPRNHCKDQDTECGQPLLTVLPLLLGPGVVALVRRHTIALSVADQVEIVDRVGVQDVASCHFLCRGAADPTLRFYTFISSAARRHRAPHAPPASLTCGVSRRGRFRALPSAPPPGGRAVRGGRAG